MLIDTLKWRCWDGKEMHRFDDLWHRTPGMKHWLYMADTGLLDANGKEIWEGDIVFFQGPAWWEEKFYYRDVCYGLRGGIEYRTTEDGNARNAMCLVDINHEPITSPYLDDFHQDKRVVVGNIHETPRVLSAKICPECHILAPHKHIYHGQCEWCTDEYGPDVDQKFTVVRKAGGHTIKLRGAEVIVTVCDEYAVTPPEKPLRRDFREPRCVECNRLDEKDVNLTEPPYMCIDCLNAAFRRAAKKLGGDKPKTIEAFQLPDADDWETDTFDKWARKRGLAHQDMKVAPATWEDWSGPYRKKSLQVFTADDTWFRAYAGQWVIKEGDTWRVADKLESDDDE